MIIGLTGPTGSGKSTVANFLRDMDFVILDYDRISRDISTKGSPCLSELTKEFGDEIVFMMIDVTDGYQETKEDAMEFIAEKGYTFPVYYDMDLSAANVYGASSLPATAFVNAEGELVHGQLGMMSEETLYGYIEKLLEK